MVKAKILAKQIVEYRSMNDRNFAASARIATNIQHAASDNTINRAEIEAIKVGL